MDIDWKFVLLVLFRLREDVAEVKDEIGYGAERKHSKKLLPNLKTSSIMEQQLLVRFDVYQMSQLMSPLFMN
jgi:hypothetical protein